MDIKKIFKCRKKKRNKKYNKMTKEEILNTFAIVEPIYYLTPEEREEIRKKIDEL